MRQKGVRLAGWVSMLLSVAAAAVALSAGSSRAEEWTIQITPRVKLAATQSTLLALNEEGPVITPMQKAPVAPAPPQPGNVDGNAASTAQAPATLTFDGSLYESIYNSIPFSRAEYVANPGYRHQAAMSIILGQPYAVTPPGYRPQAIDDDFHVDWMPGRTVFGYRPYFVRSSPWWGGFYRTGSWWR